MFGVFPSSIKKIDVCEVANVGISRANSTNRVGLLEICVCVLLPFISFFSEAVFNLTNITPSFIIAALIFASMIMALYEAGSSFYFGKFELVCFLLLGGIACAHIVCGASILPEVRIIAYTVLALFLGRYYSANAFRLFMLSIVVISVIVSVDALMKVGTYSSMGLSLYNVRHDTLVDKSAFTLVYSMSIIWLTYVFADKRKKLIRVASIALIFLFTYCGLIIIESKTLLLAYVTVVVMLALIGKIRLKPFAVIALILVVFFAMLYIALNPDILPDFVKSLLSNVFGIDVGSYNHERYDTTYSGRWQIVLSALSELSKNPFFGIGFGQFAEVSSQYWSVWGFEVTETESSWLSFLTEGGVLFFIIQLLLILKVSLGLGRLWKETGKSELMVLLCLIIFYAVINVINDFAAVSVYWCVLSLGFGVISKSEAAIKWKERVNGCAQSNT